MESFGIVTNVFRRQLDAGASLTELVAEAHGRGFNAFELRQRALGEFEDDRFVPKPQKLFDLRQQFPGATFNLAIELPIFSGSYSVQDAVCFESRAVKRAFGFTKRSRHRLTTRCRRKTACAS